MVNPDHIANFNLHDIIPHGDDASPRESAAMRAATLATRSETLADQLLKFPETWFEERKKASALPGSHVHARTYMTGAANLANEIARAKTRWIVTGALGAAAISHALGDQKILEASWKEMRLPEGRLWIEFDDIAMGCMQEIVSGVIASGTEVPERQGYMIDVAPGGRSFTIMNACLMPQRLEISLLTHHVDMDDPNRMDDEAIHHKFGGLRMGQDRHKSGFHGRVRNFAEFTSLSLGLASGIDPKQRESMEAKTVQAMWLNSRGELDRSQVDLPYDPDEVLFKMVVAEGTNLELFALLCLNHAGQVKHEAGKTNLEGTGERSLGRRYEVLREHAPATSILSLIDE